MPKVNDEQKSSSEITYDYPYNNIPLQMSYALEESMRRIIEASRNGFSMLILNHLGLTSEDVDKLVPFIADKMPNLEVLYLEGNKLTTLPDSIVNLNELIELNLNDNKIKSLPDSIIHNPNQGVIILSKNPLLLKSLLNLSYNRDEKLIFILSSGRIIPFSRVLRNPNNKGFKAIAKVFVKDYPNISLEEFNAIFKSLSSDQVHGISRLKLSLPEVGVGPDAKGDLSNELPLRDSDLTLSELFDAMKMIRGDSKEVYQACFYIARDTPRYLIAGVVDFGLSQKQVKKIYSKEMRDSILEDIVKEINKKNYANSADEGVEIGEFTKEDKALARKIFNVLIKEYPQQKLDKVASYKIYPAEQEYYKKHRAKILADYKECIEEIVKQKESSIFSQSNSAFFTAVNSDRSTASGKRKRGIDDNQPDTKKKKKTLKQS